MASTVSAPKASVASTITNTLFWKKFLMQRKFYHPGYNY